MTSEQKYDLPDQPGNTCPLIDKGLKYLSNIQEAQPRQRYIDRADEEELKSYLEDLCGAIEYNVGDIENAFESARKRAAEIREWGQAWKDLAKEQIQKAEDYESRYESVLEDCSTLKGAIQFWWENSFEVKFYSSWVYKTCFAPTFNLKEKCQVL